jgi:hypothetical protein
MSAILDQVKLYLQQAGNGEAEMPEAIIEEFGENCKKLLRSAFSKEKRKFTIRMSSIGRPLCQLQMEQAGAPKERESYATTMKFLIGDMVEAAAVAIMRGANVNIQELQKPVSKELAGQKIDGTLDVIIDDKVYDVKSASRYAFDYKFSRFNAFDEIRKDDAFGYLAQGFLYAEAAGKPFGGWIAICKETGEWAVPEVPASADLRSSVVAAAEANVSKLCDISGGNKFERCYKPIAETFNGKSTGKSYLDTTCSYCAFKHTCWAPAKLEYKPQEQSKAKNPKRFWYVG